MNKNIGILGIVLIVIAIVMYFNTHFTPLSTTATVKPTEISVTTDNPIVEVILAVGGLMLAYIGFFRK